ncbi:MAG TPA: alpha/beta fold hydrolase [Candidatus Saccharimonadales bacterium]|jgi:dienelactone hydrolase|nr:alpha/beta fold hydrolase [Candidatus Saccharimonadales bacterium]
MLMPRFRNALTRSLCGSVVMGLAVPLFSLFAVSASFAQAPALPAFQTTAKSPNFKDGKVLLEERRIRAYTYLGGDENIIRQTVQRIVRQEGDEPGGWVYEWSRLGKYYEDRGDTLLKTGLRHPALDAYMTSSVYYALAWFPNVTSQQEAKAYDAQLQVYQKGGKLFDVPLEVVKVPYKDGMITTYLHKPLGVQNPPLVIWCGGVDQYKANHWRPIQDMLAKGFAVATLDLPGFGESRQWERDMKADANFAVLDAYLKRSDIDTNRVSFFGQSYGGGATLRAALRNDTRVKAIVAMCAGLHLGEKNSLAPDAKPGDKLINGPMLVVNGTRDAGNTVPDLMSTYQSVKEGDLWLLGRGEHCAVEYWPVVIPQMADWLKEKINK